MIIGNSNQISPALEQFTNKFNAPSPEAAMRLACQKLLDLDEAGEPPIALKPLMRYLGVVSLKRRNFSNTLVSGLKTTHYGLEISIQEATAWRRTRFSWAHEIAHIVLAYSLNDPKLVASLQEDETTYNHVEDLCNLGAGELLMPYNYVKEALIKYGFTPDGLSFLYDKCLVSKRALAYRISQIIPSSGIIIWGQYSRKDSDPVVMRVVNSYPYSNNVHRPWIPANATAKKHLFPNIVLEAFESQRSIYCENVEILSGNKKINCVGIATPILKHNRMQPSFEHMLVFDEDDSSKKNNGVEPLDVMLLAVPQHLVSTVRIWAKLKENSIKL